MAKLRHLLHGAAGPETLCGAAYRDDVGPGDEVCPDCIELSFEQARATFKKPPAEPEPDEPVTLPLLE